MKSKICVITGSRAEYGLLRLTMEKIKNEPDLLLQIVVTGMHLSPKYGNTCNEIINDGFLIDRKINTLISDDSFQGISESIGLGISKFSKVLNELKPDLVVVLGDRFEIFAAVIAAHIGLVPVAHIHGGEITEGAFDDAFRHSITKMSQLHFVANKEAAKRVIQLGEQPKSVFVVGGLGVDAISKLKLLSKFELESKLNFKFRSKNLLVTFHPATLENSTAENQIKELLLALSTLNDTGLIFTLPNADTDGESISRLIEEFALNKENVRVFTSIGQLLYFSCMQFVSGVIGNSSSGILEVPSFKKGTINIGDRQRGRTQASSVINCEPRQQDILKAIKKLYSKNFAEKLHHTCNPYGPEGASNKIVSVIKNRNLDYTTKKFFYDVQFSQNIRKIN